MCPAERMLEYEGRVCRAAGHIVAVSTVDAEVMRSLYGVTRVTEIPTGVDIEFFAPPPDPAPAADLVFVGAMDWMANIDGITHFAEQILPLIRRRRPDCTLAIAGRTPDAKILELAERDPKIRVTGTVPDIRPYLWGSRVAIVPLRVGGGTRLKIYEAMAAKVPVVSTGVGAEGLEFEPEENIRIADQPEEFARHCLELLESPFQRQRMAEAAWEMVARRFSWQQVARCFEKILEIAPRASAR